MRGWTVSVSFCNPTDLTSTNYLSTHPVRSGFLLGFHHMRRLTLSQTLLDSSWNQSTTTSQSVDLSSLHTTGQILKTSSMSWVFRSFLETFCLLIKYPFGGLRSADVLTWSSNSYLRVFHCFMAKWRFTEIPHWTCKHPSPCERKGGHPNIYSITQKGQDLVRRPESKTASLEDFSTDCRLGSTTKKRCFANSEPKKYHKFQKRSLQRLNLPIESGN